MTLAKAQAVRADKPDESFAGAVYTAMRTAEEEADHWIAKFQNDSYFFEYDRLAALVNDAHCSIRSHICEAAEKYLLAHDGVIDVWPDTRGESVHQFSYKDRETDKKVPVGTVAFDFFGDDYVGKLNFLRRKKKGFVYRNEHVNKYTQTVDYIAASTRRKQLKKEMEETRNRTNALAELGTLLGIGYLTLCTLCVLACMFFGFADVIMGLFDSLETMPSDSLARNLLMILYIVAFLPGILCSWLAMLPSKIYWTLTVLLLILCAGGAVLCFFGHRELHAATVLADKAEKEYRNFVGSTEYKEAKQNDRDTIAKNTAFTEEWQRAWYDWVCSVRTAPETAEEIDKKLAEQKR